MKTLVEIKEEVAIKQGFSSYKDLLSLNNGNVYEGFADEVAKSYAREALREAAGRAKVMREKHTESGEIKSETERFWSTKEEFYQVDKESITNIELP